MLQWSHPLVFLEEAGITRTVYATVSNAIGDDTIEIRYEEDPNAKITTTASLAGDYIAIVESITNSNYTLPDEQYRRQPWYILQENDQFMLSSEPVERVVYGSDLKLTFQIALDESKKASKGNVVFTVNGERIGTPAEVNFDNSTTVSTCPVQGNMSTGMATWAR